nr:unnamed protein product [Haemonchus contortus]
MVWHASTISGAPGLIALVSDAGNYGPTLTALARGGWRIAIFHPPETSSTFLDYADEAFALPIHREQIEEQGVANLPYVLNFPTLPPPAREDCAITAMAQDLRQNIHVEHCIPHAGQSDATNKDVPIVEGDPRLDFDHQVIHFVSKFYPLANFSTGG